MRHDSMRQISFMTHKQALKFGELQKRLAQWQCQWSRCMLSFPGWWRTGVFILRRTRQVCALLSCVLTTSDTKHVSDTSFLSAESVCILSGYSRGRVSWDTFHCTAKSSSLPLTCQRTVPWAVTWPSEQVKRSSQKIHIDACFCCSSPKNFAGLHVNICTLNSALVLKKELCFAR